MNAQSQVLDKNPIIKLKVLSMTSLANVTMTFKLEDSHDFLKLDKFTGELWFRQSSFNANDVALYNLVITAERSDGTAARMTLDLHFLPTRDVADFCEKYFCFYESVTFHAIEDFPGTFKIREVGEMSPKIYSRLCKTFEADYKLVNGKVE